MGKGKKSIKRLSMKQMAEKLAELFSSQPDKVLSFKDIFR
jgi:ribonuclease R